MLIFLILNSTCSIKTISAKTRMRISVSVSGSWSSPSWEYFCWETWPTTPETWTPCIFYLTKTTNKTKMIG